MVVLKFAPLFFILTSIAIIQAQKRPICGPDACSIVDCASPGPCDKPNQVILLGGYCKCCPICYTILRQGDLCELPLIPQDSIVKCGKGLVCREKICQRVWKGDSGENGIYIPQKI